MIIAGLTALCIAALAMLPPNDYDVFYAPAVRAWLEGRSELYDQQALFYFHPPWSLLLTAPLALLPDPLGRALFALVGLAGMVVGVQSLARPSARALALALSAPFTASLVILSQWDGLIVGGAGLAWYALERRRPWLFGAALLVVATKPTNALLLAPVLLIYALRRWKLADLLRAAALGLPALAGSALASGPDWPLRLVRFLGTRPPEGYNVSLWSLLPGSVLPALVAAAAVAAVAWAATRRPMSGATLALALAASLFVSPYVVPYHYGATAPALAVALGASRRVGLALWLLVAVAFLAFFMRWGDVAFPLYLIGVTAACLAAVVRGTQQGGGSADAPAPAADEPPAAYSSPR